MGSWKLRVGRYKQVILKKNRNRFAFSIIEIVAVLVILSILGLISYKYFMLNIYQVKITRAKDDLRTLRESIESYYTIKNLWPDSLEALVNDKFLDELPIDPWHHAYLLDKFFYKVVSMGPNGILELPFGGAFGDPTGETHCWPGTWACDDIYERYYEEKIVFVSARDGNNEIYIMNIDGSEQENLTNNASADSYPNLSRDGAKIVFSTNRDGNYEIYIMNKDGTGL